MTAAFENVRSSTGGGHDALLWTPVQRRALSGLTRRRAKHAFEVIGGLVRAAWWHTYGSNSGMEHYRRARLGRVEGDPRLPETTDCSAEDAICASDD